MLEKLKMMLGLSEPTGATGATGATGSTGGSDLDTKLQWLLDTAAQRLKILLGCIDEVPEALEYIVIEVAIIRYNRIASEGMSANTVEGESLTWDAGDFDGFKDDIGAWLESQEEGNGKGKVRFI